MIMFPKNKPIRDQKYLDIIKTLPCCVCLPFYHNEPVIVPRYQAGGEYHHYGRRGKGTGQKCDDRETVPICRLHHYKTDAPGTSAKTVQKKYGVDFYDVGKTYREIYNRKFENE